MKSIPFAGRILSVGLAFALCVYNLGCGSGGGTSTVSSSGTTSVTSTVPSDLAVSEPLIQSSQSSDKNSPMVSLRWIKKFMGKHLLRSAVAAADDNAPKGFLDKTALLNQILNGTTLSDCFADLNAPDQGVAQCYGPTVYYNNHPDGQPSPGQQQDPILGMYSLPPGDLGIWNSTQTSPGSSVSEACLGAKINSLVSSYEGRLDNAIFGMAMAACVAKVNNKTLPNAGETALDLTSDVIAAATSAGKTLNITPTSITLSRLSDTTEGRPRFQFTTQATSTYCPQQASSCDVTLTLIHIPLDDLNSTYRGLLQVKHSGSFQLGVNCQDKQITEDGEAEGMSLLYEKTSSTSLKYRLRQAELCTTTSNPFSATTGEVDPSYKAISNTENPGGWANNFQQALFNIDPTNGTGIYEYVWQAGPEGVSRVLNVTITADGGTDGVPGGCGYVGYGPAVDASSGVGTIDRFICNWAGPGGSRTGQPLVQRQCLTLNSTTGHFDSIAAQEKIKFAPVNSCTYTAGSDFIYYQNDNTNHNNTNDHATDSTVTPDLIDIADMVFTHPTEPSGTGILAE